MGGYQGQDDSLSGPLEEEEKDEKDEDRPLTGDCCCQTNRDGECRTASARPLSFEFHKCHNEGWLISGLKDKAGISPDKSGTQIKGLAARGLDVSGAGAPCCLLVFHIPDGERQSVVSGKHLSRQQESS